MKKDLTPTAAPAQPDSEFLPSVVQAAESAFWQRVTELAAERFGITTGDLDPGASIDLEQAMSTALTAWVEANRTR